MAQFTPRSEVLVTETSAMMACTMTCGRRMSSLSMMEFTARIVRWPAVMIRELVSLSAQIVAVPPASESVAPAGPPGAAAVSAAGRGVVPWALGVACAGAEVRSSSLLMVELVPVVLPLNCCLSRPARSSASE